MTLSACDTLGYYGQAVRGHLALMHAARPVDAWLQDPAVPDTLKRRLRRAREIRRYAVQRLDLPDGASYRSYAALARPAAVWNVVAAPPDSLQLKRWCYVVAGCVSYRGYYSQKAARALAGRLRERDGLEVLVYGVPAYSTLGRLDWLGGDPLLSTVIERPEGELARLMFHEMAHQKVYAASDTVFNESYANAVGELGAELWLRERADAAARQAQAARDTRRRQFLALVRRTRAELARVYDRADAPHGRDGMMAAKAAARADFRQRYADLKQQWADAGSAYAGYDGWVARANNAGFGLQAAYDTWVPVFRAVHACVDADWRRFHGVARRLAALPASDRQERLNRWQGMLAAPAAICRELAEPGAAAVRVQSAGASW